MLQSKKQVFSQYKYTRSYDESQQTRLASTAGDAADSELMAKLTSNSKRTGGVAPLVTIGPPYHEDDLPELEEVDRNDYRGSNDYDDEEAAAAGFGSKRCPTLLVRSPPPPPPLPKSATAIASSHNESGCMDVVQSPPPPPPPSHSPDHRKKLQKFRLRLGSSSHHNHQGQGGGGGRPSTSPSTRSQNPWYGGGGDEANGGSALLPLPPTPLSKGLSGGSGSTYPTVSPNSASSISGHPDKSSKPSGRKGVFLLRRPKSAGDGMTHHSSRLPLSATAVSQNFSRAFASSALTRVSDRESFITFQETEREEIVSKGAGSGTFAHRRHRERTQSESCSLPLSAGSDSRPATTVEGEITLTKGRDSIAGPDSSVSFFQHHHHRPTVASPLSSTGQLIISDDNQSCPTPHFRLLQSAQPPPHHGGRRRQTDIDSDARIAEAESEIEQEEEILLLHQREQSERYYMEEGQEEEVSGCASLPSSADALSDMSGTLKVPSEGYHIERTLSPTPLPPPLRSPTPPPAVTKG